MPNLGLILRKEEIVEAEMGDGEIAVAVRLKCPESGTGTITMFPAEPVLLPGYEDVYYLHLGRAEETRFFHVKVGDKYIRKEYSNSEIVRFQQSDPDEVNQ